MLFSRDFLDFFIIGKCHSTNPSFSPFSPFLFGNFTLFSLYIPTTHITSSARSSGAPDTFKLTRRLNPAESGASLSCRFLKIDVENAERATIWGCFQVEGASLNRECLHTPFIRV